MGIASLHIHENESKYLLTMFQTVYEQEAERRNNIRVRLDSAFRFYMALVAAFVVGLQAALSLEVLDTNHAVFIIFLALYALCIVTGMGFLFFGAYFGKGYGSPVFT